MPRTGRPKLVLELTDEERDQLVRWERRPKSSQAAAMRARIVLGCDEGLNNTAVARKLHITGATVCKGANGSGWTGWKAFWMSRGWARPARSPTQRLRR